MDRAYCLSLEREVEISEVIELYRQGIITSKGDFACLDPECRTAYVCVNLGKPIFKISPHFKTAIKAERGHADSCSYEIQHKVSVPIESGRLIKPRNLIDSDTEIVFTNSRPKKYFVVPGNFKGMTIDITCPLRYIPAGFSGMTSEAANPKCYAIENLLNGGWGGERKLVLDGNSGTIKSTFIPIDNNIPDMHRRYIYCGLAKFIVSDDDCYTFKFGRSFRAEGRLADVFVKFALRAIDTTRETKYPYYRLLIDRVLEAARSAVKYPNNPLFLYVLGCPKLTDDLESYIFEVDNLDHFYIESRCYRQLLISPAYSDWERNQHYFV